MKSSSEESYLTSNLSYSKSSGYALADKYAKPICEKSGVNDAGDVS